MANSNNIHSLENKTIVQLFRIKFMLEDIQVPETDKMLKERVIPILNEKVNHIFQDWMNNGGGMSKDNYYLCVSESQKIDNTLFKFTGIDHYNGGILMYFTENSGKKPKSIILNFVGLNSHVKKGNKEIITAPIFLSSKNSLPTMMIPVSMNEVGDIKRC